MPEHVLMSEIEIITDGGRRRRWSAGEPFAVSALSLNTQTQPEDSRSGRP
jgi:transposase